MAVSIKVTAKVLGAEDARKAMRAFARRMGGDPRATVGFGARYALRVHETHKTKSKFLTNALNEVRRGYKRDLAAKTRRLEKQGHPRPLAGAITQKAFQVEAKAVPKTPVKTGEAK
jgi:hypothetical protein